MTSLSHWYITIRVVGALSEAGLTMPCFWRAISCVRVRAADCDNLW